MVCLWTNAGLNQSFLLSTGWFDIDDNKNTNVYVSGWCCKIWPDFGVKPRSFSLSDIILMLISLSPLLRSASWHQHWRICPTDVQVWHRDEGPFDWRIQSQTVQGQRGKSEGWWSVLLPQGKYSAACFNLFFCWESAYRDYKEILLGSNKTVQDFALNNTML